MTDDRSRTDALAAALEQVERDGLIVLLGVGDPEQRTDFTEAPAEVAAAILAATPSGEGERLDRDNLREEIDRHALIYPDGDALCECRRWQGDVSWAEHVAERILARLAKEPQDG